MIKPIEFSSKNVGKVVVTTTIEQDENSKFAIKGIAGTILLCADPRMKKDPRMKEMLKILDEATSKIHNLFSPEEEDAFPNL